MIDQFFSAASKLGHTIYCFPDIFWKNDSEKDVEAEFKTKYLIIPINLRIFLSKSWAAASSCYLKF